jgi:anti-anti-sigma factor
VPITSPPFRSPLSLLPPPQPPPLFMANRRVEPGGSIYLLVAGELDLPVQRHFESALAEAQDDSDRVLLDLSALTFIDCACLATLFIAAMRGRRDQAALILLAPRGQVRRLLDVVGAPPGVAVLDHGDLPEHRAPVAA